MIGIHCIEHLIRSLLASSSMLLDATSSMLMGLDVRLQSVLQLKLLLPHDRRLCAAADSIPTVDFLIVPSQQLIAAQPFCVALLALRNAVSVSQPLSVSLSLSISQPLSASPFLSTSQTIDLSLSFPQPLGRSLSLSHSLGLSV